MQISTVTWSCRLNFVYAIELPSSAVRCHLIFTIVECSFLLTPSGFSISAKQVHSVFWAKYNTDYVKKELIFHSNIFMFLYQMSVKKLNFVAKAKPLKFRKLWAANFCQVSDFNTAVLLSNKRSHNILVKVLFTSVVVKATLNASFEFARNLFRSSFFIR